MDAAEAYSTLNMGVGYAVYCAPGEGRGGARRGRRRWASERCWVGASKTVRGG